MKILTWILPVLFAGNAIAAGMTPSAAFTEGTTFGNANVGTAKAKIDSGVASDASSGVPNYTTSHPASGYYSGGLGSLTAPASTSVLGCTSTTGSSDPDPHTHGQCESTRMLMDDPGKKNVMFPLNPKTDPIAVTRDLVSGDAETYLGSLIVSGAYSGCATKTVKDPDTYQTETCNQYLTAGEESCQEILTVTVSVEFCEPGTVLWSYSTYKADTIRIVCDPNPSKLRITGNLTGWCYNNYSAFGHLAYVSVEATPQILQKGFIDFYRLDECKQYASWTDENGNVYFDYDNCLMWGPGPVHGPIAGMHPETTPNNVLFGSYYRRGCMLELKPSSCDLAAETCTFNLKFINQYNWDDSYYPDIIADLATPPLKTPQYHVETDTWDNQCGPLEARLP